MRKKTTWFILSGLFVALILAGVVSHYASSSPDGLDSATLKGCATDAQGRITGGHCAAQKAKKHDLETGPFAGYATSGLGGGFASTAVSGVVGVAVVFGIGAGAFWLLKRRAKTPEQG
ncbi:MAG TPA: PDGLE domain-containing protein [Stackebrandtia sp.]|jgi:cobalt/nickel transport protein|uniref:PDGLE domain-containing protein n=1 Tax=Stackebrandtia sp. TaxID=2023065 RepID=UPI002D537192|nr:PDGLE domain-containing protein [Stackebrandtia sp.]HZE39665.1 PDGLE domain-containing protein [Stackebrandtia sp.]